MSLFLRHKDYWLWLRLLSGRKGAKNIKAGKKAKQAKVTMPLPVFPATTEYQNNTIEKEDISKKK